MADYRGAASELGRAKHLLKKREIELQEIENKRKKIEQDCHVENITDKFAKAPTTFIDQTSNSARVGLKTIDEFKAILNSPANIRDSKLTNNANQDRKQTERDERQKIKKAKTLKKLSFGDDEEDDVDDDDKCDNDNDNATVKINETTAEPEAAANESTVCVTKPVRRLEKNPNVDTSFLPDREREELEEIVRNEIRQEWLLKQQRLKDEQLVVVFSYWDGFGHRRQLQIKKGKTIYEFLQKALEILRVDFMELKSTSADQLMYIKEDLILPHHYSFYDFIVRKTRGKSGPLFNFDVHDDVRLYHDARVEKDESHAGKVLLRSWYERHKHIFPASRWEPFDPTKDYAKYTICDKRN